MDRKYKTFAVYKWLWKSGITVCYILQMIRTSVVFKNGMKDEYIQQYKSKCNECNICDRHFVRSVYM